MAKLLQVFPFMGQAAAAGRVLGEYSSRNPDASALGISNPKRRLGPRARPKASGEPLPAAFRLGEGNKKHQLHSAPLWPELTHSPAAPFVLRLTFQFESPWRGGQNPPPPRSLQLTMVQGLLSLPKFELMLPKKGKTQKNAQGLLLSFLIPPPPIVHVILKFICIHTAQIKKK